MSIQAQLLEVFETVECYILRSTEDVTDVAVVYQEPSGYVSLTCFCGQCKNGDLLRKAESILGKRRMPNLYLEPKKGGEIWKFMDIHQQAQHIREAVVEEEESLSRLYGPIDLLQFLQTRLPHHETDEKPLRGACSA